MEQNIYSAIYKVNHADGCGSCFYLKQYDLFVISYHAVEGFRQVVIQGNDKNLSLARIIMINPVLDIALLLVERGFSALPGIRLSELKEVTIGQKINIAGYPFDMPFAVAEGTVSSPRQLVNNSYYIQANVAVNPGNSGGPMFNERDELTTVTASGITDADNMGFDIPVDILKEVLENIESLDRFIFNVQCNSCDEFISEEDEYCPCCGDKLPEEIFKERGLTDLAVFYEETIEAMGINPILAHVGYEGWKFYKESSEIRMPVYDRSYLFAASPLDILPEKNLEPVPTYLLQTETAPYRSGLDENQVYLPYRVHISDILSDYSENAKTDLTHLAFRADDLDNYLVDTFSCKFSEYVNKNAIWSIAKLFEYRPFH